MVMFILQRCDGSIGKTFLEHGTAWTEAPSRNGRVGSENDNHSNVADIKDTDGESGEKRLGKVGGGQAAQSHWSACRGNGRT